MKKFKNSICDKTQAQIVKKESSDKTQTQIVTKKTQIVTKLKNSNCDKAPIVTKLKL